MNKFEVGDFIYWKHKSSYLVAEITKVSSTRDLKHNKKIFFFRGKYNGLNGYSPTNNFMESSKVYDEGLNLGKSNLAKLLYGIGNE